MPKVIWLICSGQWLDNRLFWLWSSYILNVCCHLSISEVQIIINALRWIHRRTRSYFFSVVAALGIYICGIWPNSLPVKHHNILSAYESRVDNNTCYVFSLRGGKCLIKCFQHKKWKFPERFLPNPFIYQRLNSTSAN